MKKCLVLSLLVIGLGWAPAWAQPGISVSVGNNGWGNGVQWGITVGNGPNCYPANYPLQNYPVYNQYPVYSQYPVQASYPVYNAFPGYNYQYNNVPCGQVYVPQVAVPCAPRYRRFRCR